MLGQENGDQILACAAAAVETHPLKQTLPSLLLALKLQLLPPSLDLVGTLGASGM